MVTSITIRIRDFSFLYEVLVKGLQWSEVYYVHIFSIIVGLTNGKSLIQNIATQKKVKDDCNRGIISHNLSWTQKLGTSLLARLSLVAFLDNGYDVASRDKVQCRGHYLLFNIFVSFYYYRTAICF